MANPIDAADEASFAGIVERHARQVFRVAYAVLRNAHDAEDVVQETFWKLYRTAAWRRMENERAFLTRSAWRLAVERLPAAHRTAPEPELRSPAASPEDAAIAADWSAAVHRLVDALPEELRQPLALSAMHELTSPEIAALMGLPEGTVRRRIMRAREILKERLAVLKERRHER